MMGNPDPEAEVKEDQTVYEGLVMNQISSSQAVHVIHISLVLEKIKPNCGF